MRNISYFNFSKTMHDKALKSGFPLRVIFEITYRCNFKCRHCYVPQSYCKSKNRELSTKQVFKILDELSEMGCFYIGFTGGEPFLREDFLDILCYARKKGFQIIIYTNGSLIDKKMARALKKMAINKVSVTVHSLRENVFDNITQVKNSAKQVFSNIEFMHKEKIHLGLKTCVLEENKKDIDKIARFADKIKADFKFDDKIFPPLNEKNFKFYNEALEQEKKNVKNLTDTYAKNFSRKLFWHCPIGRSQLAIDPFGRLKLCVLINYPLYNIVSSSLMSKWREMKKIVERLPKKREIECKGCAKLSSCQWCPAVGWLGFGDLTKCYKKGRLVFDYAKQT